MGFAPPPIDYDLLDRMTPEQRRRFIEREQAFLRRCVANSKADFWWGVRLVGLVALIVLGLLACQAFAIDLPESCRVRNLGPQCAWANLSTLGKLHSIPALASLAPRREARPAATDDNVRRQLHALKLHWRGYDHGSFNRELLPLANSRGVIVSVRPGTAWMWGKTVGCLHSIILTRYDAQGVAFYCPNNPQKIWTASLAWLDSSWAGNSLVFDTQD